MADPVAPTPPAETGGKSAPVEAAKAPAPPAEQQTPPAVDPLKPRFDALQQAQQKHAAERQKFAEERKANEERMRKLEDWERIQSDRRRNPLKYLSQEFGEDWYDKLTQIKVNGTTTPDLIASEFDEREKSLRDEFKSEAQKLREELEKRDAAELAREKASHEAQAVAFVKQNAEKFPLINLFEQHAAVPAAIERHFIETCEQGPDGELIPGEMWTPEQAAEAIEKQMLEVEKKILERQKAAKPAAPQAQPSERLTGTPQRRSLSTEMTTSTGGEWTPPKDDAERMRRALAAMDNAIAARGGAA